MWINNYIDEKGKCIKQYKQQKNCTLARKESVCIYIHEKKNTEYELFIIYTNSFQFDN